MVICLERCARLAYGPADATATPSSHAVHHGLSFWYWLTGCPGKKDVKLVVVAVPVEQLLSYYIVLYRSLNYTNTSVKYFHFI